MNLEELKRVWKEPLREYGPVPFFALNSDLAEEELVFALEEMAKAGMAGVFLHPRTGLEIEYLSEEFFEKMRIAIETCARLGLKAWLYDEYNWPSGVVAGKLLKKHPEFRQKFLDYLILEKVKRGKELELPGEVVAVFAIDERVEMLKGIFEGKRTRIPRLNGQVLIFYQAESRERMFVNSCAKWIEPEPGYLDLMNPEAVKVFMEMTYEQYAQRFSEHFGKTIPGIFTDEPQHYNGFPWSELFRKKFQAEYGYDPVLQIYQLVLDRGNYIRFRVQFYELVARLMKEAFYQPLSRWCAEHNLILTGHLGMEERITQIPANHGGIYPHLSEMQMPGIDALNVGDGLNGGLSNMEAPNFSAKAVTSIAHLCGRNRVLCEAGGGAGWQMPLWRFKLMTDWLFGMGINLINPHQSLLSIKGLRKRDFPPSHFWQEPWWEYYPEFSQYVSRLSWLLAQGEHQAEIAVLVPSMEFKARFRGRGFRDDDLKRLSAQIENLCKNLLMAQRDFELVFEEAIKEGKIRAEQGKIIAGTESFEVLIIPAVQVLAQETMALIERFAQGGGNLIFLGPLPAWDQEGNSSNDWQAHLLGYKDRVRIFSEPEPPENLLIETLARIKTPDLTLSGYQPFRIVFHKRKLGEIEIYFLANLEPTRFRVRARLKTEKNGLELFLPFSGETQRIPFSRERDALSFQLDFSPLDSSVLIASDQIPAPWVKETDLILKQFDEKQIWGFFPEPKVRLKTKDQELKLESNLTLPPRIPVSGPFKFEPLSFNFFRLGPWKVITEKLPSRPLSQLKNEFFFSRTTRTLLYFLKPVIGLLNFLFRPEANYRGLVYQEFGRLEEDLARFQKISGMALEQRGLYQMFDLLVRFSEYLPLRTWFRVYPPPGSYYEAHTNFTLERVFENLTLVWEDLGEPVEIRLNGRKLELKPKRVRVWDPANLELEIKPYVKPGKNHLIFRSKMPEFPCLFPSFHTLEPVVLRGDFEVKKRGILSTPEGIKPTKDLRELGYPHYSGKVRYRAEVEIPKEYLDFYLLLDCGEVRDQIEVLVNGKSAGKKFNPPYEFPIRELVQAGRNEIEFIVSNTAGNLLGVPERFGLLGPVWILPFFKFEARPDPAQNT